MEIIEFIFSSFWHFIGACILINVTGRALSAILSALFYKKK